MSTATAEVEKEIAPYLMPKPRMGDVVYWTRSPNDEGYCAGIVNKIGLRTIDLHVLIPNNQQLVLKTGVHHRDDPDSKKGSQDPVWFQGVWWEREPQVVYGRSTESTSTTESLRRIKEKLG